MKVHVIAFAAMAIALASLILSLHAIILIKKKKKSPPVFYSEEDMELLHQLKDSANKQDECTRVAQRAVRYLQIDENLFAKQTVENVAKEVGTNRNYLSRAINTCYRLNFPQLLSYLRVVRTCNYFLEDTSLKPRELFARSGFKSFSSYSSSFTRYTNMSPVKWTRDVVQRLENKEIVSAYDYVRKLTVQNSYEEFD